ncbi:MAG TPA: ADOP family duplicated permease [Terriglobales bacterium]|nr:ADOP family duplicated permease [Terriglobales bacterium]
MGFWQLTRNLLRQRRYTLAAVFTLALGVGATTVIFAAVNGVLLQPLALRDPGGLVRLGQDLPDHPPSDPLFRWFVNPAEFIAWQRLHSFTGIAASQASSMTLITAGQPQLIDGAHVTPNLFSILETRPQLGRTFVAGEEKSTLPPVVITDALWRKAFGANPAVIGQSIGAIGLHGTVVGVLPPDFHLEGPELGPMYPARSPQFFYPLGFGADENISNPFSDFNYMVIARLAPGVSIASAKAEMNVTEANLVRSAHSTNRLTAIVDPLANEIVAPAERGLWMLLAGVGALLLIVCVNLGGLSVTKAADRRREWAIRLALGASRQHLAGTLLMENLLLGLVGGGLGLLAAAAGLRGLLAAAPTDLPRLNDIHLDVMVFSFSLAIAVLAGLGCGLVPAMWLWRSDPQAHLKASRASDRASLRARSTVIAVEVGLCAVLLATVGLLGMSLYRLLQVPVGFSSERTASTVLHLGAATPQLRLQHLQQVATAAATLPGVSAATLTTHLPLQGETWVDGASVPGKAYANNQNPEVNVRFVAPGYFDTMRMPLLAGRDLSWSDPPDRNIVVSETALRTLWPELDHKPVQVVGRPLKVNSATLTVVGVAADARTALDRQPPPVIYETAGSFPMTRFTLVVRSNRTPDDLSRALAGVIHRIEPTAPLSAVLPLSSLEAALVAPRWFQLALLICFGVLALILAALGLYALVAQAVTQRLPELGIRLALGAEPGQLRGLILRQGLKPVFIGLAIGLAAAAAGGSLLASMLFEVQPVNFGVLAAVAATVLFVALLAALAPAQRATQADPRVALRAE